MAMFGSFGGGKSPYSGMATSLLQQKRKSPQQQGASMSPQGPKGLANPTAQGGTYGASPPPTSTSTATAGGVSMAQNQQSNVNPTFGINPVMQQGGNSFAANTGIGAPQIGAQQNMRGSGLSGQIAKPDELAQKYAELMKGRTADWGMQQKMLGAANARDMRAAQSQLGAQGMNLGGSGYLNTLGATGLQGINNTLNAQGQYEADLKNLMLDELEKRRQIKTGENDIQTILAGLA